MKYEYKFVYLGYCESTVEAEIKLLNELGREGWQVVDRDRGGYYMMREYQ
jgi:hypothetical protein